ncbi:ABC transporter permease [Actinoallomurus rhizosphaericola]|uniref:ABC transporter permease n=1 Tax=Actinoallomurus rhizosphaericola TaxID=2952536 RepID=UPI002092E59F|nr:ABC transporter permease [Actinoallomurus rhizosphaericola]MCO5999164.1 ABC transporter permease [Actinoallomurus rhizosphaericola]
MSRPHRGAPSAGPHRGAPSARSRPAARPWYARWSGDLALGARLAFAGGRPGWSRIAMTAVGVGLGVMMLLVAASMPTMLHARGERTAARDYGTAGTSTPSDRSLLIGVQDTDFYGQSIRGRVLRPEGPRAPLPPGVAAFPNPGEMVVSPALADLLSSREGALLRPRLGYRVVGRIGHAGLGGAQEYAYYAGSDRLTLRSGLVVRVTSFGSRSPGEGLGPVLVLLVVIAFVVLLLPVAVFIGTAMRFGGESSDRRLAALRLMGADQRMARRFAAAEALLASVFGLLVGALMFLVVRVFVEQVTVFGVGFFTADVRPALQPAVLIAVAVPVSSVLVTLFSLRKVMIEPLGVVRSATRTRRRLWWRPIVPVIGLALLYPLLRGVQRLGSFNEYQVAAGVALLLIGIATLLPWIVEAVVGRLGSGGGLSWQLAVRRLQLDGGTSVRAVSGIVVAVAGAIALQTMFTGVRGDYVQETGQDTSRAQAQVTFRGAVDGTRAAGAAARLGSAPGVRGALAKATTSLLLPGTKKDDSSVTLTVADCAALREAIRIGRCADGDVFIAGLGKPAPRPGETVRVDPDEDTGGGHGPSWRIPKSARPAEQRTDPLGETEEGVFATPSAVDPRILRTAHVTMLVRVNTADGDAVERMRNAVAALDPMADVTMLTGTQEDNGFGAVRRGLFIGAIAALLVIGAVLLVTVLEQMKQRRRLLAMLVAFGTRRSVLNWSVLWQTTVPMVLGVLLAVPAGTGIGALLLKISEKPVSINWAAVTGICGAAAGVVLLVTALSLPTVRRLMDPEGLRTE